MARQKGLFGRAFDKIKSIFVLEPEKPKPVRQTRAKPKPTPVVEKPQKKPLPTTRPVPQKKTAEEIAKAKEVSDRARQRRLRRERREREAYDIIFHHVGNAEDAYGNPTFDAAHVRQRLRRLPNEQSLVDIINAKTMDEIDQIYAEDQTEFTGYDNPAQFWYH